MFVEGSYNDKNGHPSFEADYINVTIGNKVYLIRHDADQQRLICTFVNGSPHNVDAAQRTITEMERKVDDDYWPAENVLVYDGYDIQWRVVGTYDAPIIEWKCGFRTGSIEMAVAQDLDGLSVEEIIIKRFMELGE